MARKTNAELEAEVRALRIDIATINSVLLEEANDRDWCDEYDEVIGKINDRLGAAELSTRSRDYTVSITLSADVSVGAEVVVKATDEAEAEAMVARMSLDVIAYELSKGSTHSLATVIAQMIEAGSCEVTGPPMVGVEYAEEA